MDKKTVISALEAARMKHGLSFRDIAFMLNITESYVTNIRRHGVVSPRLLENIECLTAALDNDSAKKERAILHRKDLFRSAQESRDAKRKAINVFMTVYGLKGTM